MDFTNPHFAEPGWLWLAVLAPLVAFGLQRYAARRRRRQLAVVASVELLPELLRSHSRVRRHLKDALLLGTLALMGIAMARPQWGQTTQTAVAAGEDILFVLDCSRSMLATDLPPNRLTRAKYAILNFVQQHAQGRVGLVAFAGDAFLQCPLTFDYDAFREALLAVDQHTIPVPGTDIGRALEEGAAAMEENAHRKILVLVTDGEDLEGNGVKEAQRLARKGVVVFTIGVGTPAGDAIPIPEAMGRIGYIRNRHGQVVISRLDATTLRRIAEATGGRYEPLGPLGRGMDVVRRQIENSSKAPGVVPLRTLGVDRFHFPVALAIGLLVAESLLGTRRKRSPTA